LRKKKKKMKAKIQGDTNEDVDQQKNSCGPEAQGKNCARRYWPYESSSRFRSGGLTFVRGLKEKGGRGK